MDMMISLNLRDHGEFHAGVEIETPQIMGTKLHPGKTSVTRYGRKTNWTVSISKSAKQNELLEDSSMEARVYSPAPTDYKKS